MKTARKAQIVNYDSPSSASMFFFFANDIICHAIAFARRRGGILFAFSALVAFKLWLVHGEEIMGAAGEYDQIINLKASRYWYWGQPYTWTAFMRPPAFPLFMALSHRLGVPLRLALELLQLGAIWFLLKHCARQASRS